MKKDKGFTLIELLVVVAIIGILATVVLASLGTARTRSKDAAISSSLSSYRTQAELDYPQGNYTGLCTSSNFLDIQSYIEERSGTIDSCESDTNSYRIVARLASGNNISSILTTQVYAQEGCNPEEEECIEEGGEESDGTTQIPGYCINSNGTSSRVALSEAQSFSGTSFCSISEVLNGGVAPYWNCAEVQCYLGTSTTDPQLPESVCDAAGLNTFACGI